LPVALIGSAIAFYGEVQKKKPDSYRSILNKIIVVLVTIGILLVPLWRSPFFSQMTTIRLSTSSVLNDTELPITARQWQTVDGVTRLDRWLWHRYVLLTKQFLDNYVDHLSADFLFVHGDSNLRHGTGYFGVFPWWTAPLLIIGLGILAERKPLTLLWLGSWWAVAIVPAAIPNETPHLLRSLHSIVPITLIMSVGGAVFSQGLFKRLQHQQLRAAVTGVLMVVLFELLYFTWMYQTIYQVHSQPAWQSEYTGLADQIVATPAEYTRVYVFGIDSRFYLWILWRGTFDYDEVATWPRRDWSFAEFDRYYFEKYNLDHIPVQEKFAVIVDEGLQSEIFTELSKTNKYQLQVKELPVQYARKKFEMILVNPKPL
jgi:hypothetical protein